MTDVWMDPDGPAVGTVLQEDFHSIWVVVEDKNDTKSLYCVYSIFTGNRGQELGLDATDAMKIIGSVPASPASDSYGFALSADQ